MKEEEVLFNEIDKMLERVVDVLSDMLKGFDLSDIGIEELVKNKKRYEMLRPWKFMHWDREDVYRVGKILGRLEGIYSIIIMSQMKRRGENV